MSGHDPQLTPPSRTVTFHVVRREKWTPNPCDIGDPSPNLCEENPYESPRAVKSAKSWWETRTTKICLMVVVFVALVEVRVWKSPPSLTQAVIFRVRGTNAKVAIGKNWWGANCEPGNGFTIHWID